MSLDIRIDVRGFLPAEMALDRLSALQEAQLLDGLGRQIHQQTVRRIEEEKTAPDGKAWKRNSEGTPTLYREGHLARSIDWVVQGLQVAVGSALIYAPIHQYGGTIAPKTADALAFMIGNRFVMTQKVTMPARPYLGVSADNAADILDVAKAFIRKALGL